MRSPFGNCFEKSMDSKSIQRWPGPTRFVFEISHAIPSYLDPLDDPGRWTSELLLMAQKSGDHQLRLVVYPIVYRVFYMYIYIYILGGAGSLPSTVVLIFNCGLQKTAPLKWRVCYCSVERVFFEWSVNSTHRISCLVMCNQCNQRGTWITANPGAFRQFRFASGSRKPVIRCDFATPKFQVKRMTSIAILQRWMSRNKWHWSATRCD